MPRARFSGRAYWSLMACDMTNQLVFGVRKTSSNATIPIFRFFVMQGTGKLATYSAVKKVAMTAE